MVSTGFMTLFLSYLSEKGLTGLNWVNGGGRTELYLSRVTKRKREKHKIVSLPPVLNAS